MSTLTLQRTGPTRFSAAGNPAVLLLTTGTLIGFNFPLGKIAGEAGISPLVWAMLVSLGASGVLLPILSVQRRLTMPNLRMVRYIVISGLVSFVIPNLLLFSVIPKTGAGYTGLMFALSPVFTLTLAVLCGLERPDRMGLWGIAFGLIGAATVSLTRGSAAGAPPTLWLVAALLVPLLLACGNIYRTWDWPDGAQPDVLAFWSHAFAVVVFATLSLAFNASLPLAELASSPLAALAQMAVAGATFPVFFRLQQRGGPVLLSQIGYVAAAVGLIAATLLLGEHYGTVTWIGAGIVALGIGITVTSQWTEA
ncbi:DMT family transporter [Sulfidibacter corallicola]|uniref:DMT family transporter n=1 Tax=Sulfidibacter corallicola TaxID=2818388 RepID=A0A8A4TJU9_SULCO|nr:DMT family transporter [Sulfidibacter corallicola]QTD49757.1 DMT family transporter [Sulfidibacter corallicola]